jgi:hypothetical protein
MMDKRRLAMFGSALLSILVVVGYFFYRQHNMTSEKQAAAQQEAAASHGDIHTNTDSDPDDLVFVKSEHPISLEDEKALKGRTLWVSAGGQMDYFPYNGHTVDFKHSPGTLLGAQKILVKDAVLAQAPKSAAFRIPQGQGQVFLVFTMPEDAATEYAVAVGDKEGKIYNLVTDQAFFYDDPHKLFDYWGPKIWQAIDEHKAIPGMTEREVQMALGQVSVPHGATVGERTVDFDDQGKPKVITFEGGKATKIVDR